LLLPKPALPGSLRSYGLMGQTKTLPPPSVAPIAVGLCRLLPVPAGRWPFPTLSLQSFHRCLDPYPVVFLRCTYPFLPGELRPHVRSATFGTPYSPCNATSTGHAISRRQSFRYVQAPMFARPQGFRAAGPFTPRNEHTVTRTNCGITTCLKRAIDMAGLSPVEYGVITSDNQ
jgi:hypothetical protein